MLHTLLATTTFTNFNSNVLSFLSHTPQKNWIMDLLSWLKNPLFKVKEEKKEEEYQETPQVVVFEMTDDESGEEDESMTPPHNLEACKSEPTTPPPSPEKMLPFRGVIMQAEESSNNVQKMSSCSNGESGCWRRNLTPKDLDTGDIKSLLKNVDNLVLACTYKLDNVEQHLINLIKWRELMLSSEHRAQTEQGRILEIKDELESGVEVMLEKNLGELNGPQSQIPSDDELMGILLSVPKSEDESLISMSMSMTSSISVSPSRRSSRVKSLNICPTCAKSFASADVLKMHLKTHPRDQNITKSVAPSVLQCSACPKKYTRAHNLRAHYEAVHLGRYWLCPLCPFQGKSKGGLAIHTKRNHH